MQSEKCLQVCLWVKSGIFLRGVIHVWDCKQSVLKLRVERLQGREIAAGQQGALRTTFGVRMCHI